MHKLKNWVGVFFTFHAQICAIISFDSAITESVPKTTNNNNIKTEIYRLNSISTNISRKYMITIATANKQPWSSQATKEMP